MVKDAIRLSSMQKVRACVTDAVIDIVVDKVWTAFKAVMVVKVPFMSIITSDDAIPSLRVLAVFACPAPERHKEVREHALKPLGDDAQKILTDQTKARLTRLFDDWLAAA
jgi:hypothetical protein